MYQGLLSHYHVKDRRAPFNAFKAICQQRMSGSQLATRVRNSVPFLENWEQQRILCSMLGQRGELV